MGRARDSARNWRKPFKAFFPRTACSVGLKSSLCNLPGKALHDDVRIVVIQPPVPYIKGGTYRQTHTHTQTHIRTEYEYYYIRYLQNSNVSARVYGAEAEHLLSAISHGKCNCYGIVHYGE